MLTLYWSKNFVTSSIAYLPHNNSTIIFNSRQFRDNPTNKCMVHKTLANWTLKKCIKEQMNSKTNDDCDSA